MFLLLLTKMVSSVHSTLPDVALWQLAVEMQQCGCKEIMLVYPVTVSVMVLLAWVDSLLTYLVEVAAVVPRVLQVLLKSHGTVRLN
tara:strand:- start:601 stop:858 length:258 start_codon:yes stop_codon:yes gene_type:complete